MIITVIVPALADPSNAYHQQQLYVLNSLAQVKSIVLLTDLPGSDQLITLLFTSCFDVVASSSMPSAGEQLGKTVELHMTSILSVMVDESENLPSEVVDVIVAQFLRTDPRIFKSGTAGKGKKGAQQTVDEKQSTLALKELPPSYNMAKTICNSCADKMSRYFSQYFSDVVIDASSQQKDNAKKVPNKRTSEGLGDEDHDLSGGPTEDDLRELRKVHQLLQELWRACPTVLQHVVPQLETEMSAENVHLRLIATETLGNIVSGIGSAGLPVHPVPDPAAYPPFSLSDSPEVPLGQNVLTKPSSPQPFSQVHPHAYSIFLSRCHDKSPIIRAAWATGVGRIVTTSAGGVGLNQHEEGKLIAGLAKALGDADEKVRLAAVTVVGSFGFHDTIYKLGSSGGLNKSGSALAVLAERIRDRKPTVRKEAMTVLARLWGIASGELGTGNELVTSILGQAPSKILDTYYANDFDIHVLLDHVLFEDLIPLSFPPIKPKASKLSNGNSQKGQDGSGTNGVPPENLDPDKIRVDRILVLVKSLEEKAKKVFFAVQARQFKLAQVMKVYLQRCEDYNGGVIDGNEKEIKAHLGRLIENLAKVMPDSSRVQEHLWKFAKMHDRRSYQLIRFCMAPESDFRTVYKAFKEFQKRLPTLPNSPHDLLNSMIPLLYRVSAVVYNKSHVPAIMQASRSDDKSLASSAHEILREISSQTPEVLRAQVKEICLSLEDEAPDSKKVPKSGSIDNLKACAAFAAKFPDEIPRERSFIQATKNYALYGNPPEAAKHAVTILMTASEQKEMLAHELLQKCVKDFRYGGNGFLARLATLSQLMLLAPDQVNEAGDAVSDIAIAQILLQVRTASLDSSKSYEWSPSADVECEAKYWSLKILVNRVRSHTDPETLTETAEPVYKLLLTLITDKGEIAPKDNTPPGHKSRLRLLAARQVLKLCVKRSTDALVTAHFFNALALVAQDSLLPVRSSFMQRLRKYLGLQKLPQRFFAIPFLLAFEPSQTLRSDTTTWIRSRANYFALLRAEQASPKPPPMMESVFARLISLLAHHPDYSSVAEDLLDFARYITFYLQTVATEDNLSFIYQIAQRVKQCQDGISNSKTFDQNLYTLSDLAQLTIRKFEDIHSWSIQTLPGKLQLPKSLFSEVRDHAKALHIAEHDYLPDEVKDGLDALLKQSIRSARNPTGSAKKRKSDAVHEATDRGAKKGKSLPIRKGSGEGDAPFSAKKAEKKTTSSSKKASKATKSDNDVPAGERRRSSRAHRVGAGKYAERDDDDDDEEMGEGGAEWKYMNEDGDEIASDEPAADANGEEVDEEAEENDVEAAGGSDEGEDEEEDVRPIPKSISKSPRTAKTASRSDKPTAAARKRPPTSSSKPAKKTR